MGLSKEQRLLAEVEIKSLLIRERYQRDTSQWVQLRDSWHPDASRTLLKISWFTGDIDAFIEGSKKMAQGGSVASHTITPVDVHFSTSGNKALSESTGNITMRFQLDHDDDTHGSTSYELVSWTRFVSKLEKSDDEWKLVSLEPIYDRDTIVPAVPLQADGQIPRTTFQKGARESYSSLAWLLDRRGFQVDMDLAGTDRPKSVEGLMKGQLRWLES